MVVLVVVVRGVPVPVQMHSVVGMAHATMARPVAVAQRTAPLEHLRVAEMEYPTVERTATTARVMSPAKQASHASTCRHGNANGRNTAT
ncbi:MAG: hypothetical protein NT130_03685 [Candidatus Micrarchaeota archaeon]|nr:hypothetical protein [Candidatus Micrarchaeota archaeon]